MRLKNPVEDLYRTQAAAQFNSLRDVLSNNTAFSSADQIFVDEATTNDVQAAFKNLVSQADFNNATSAAAQINGWVAKNSQNLIKELVEPEGMPENLRMMLVNVMLFKGEWEKKFNPDYIFKSKFNNLDKTTPTVEYMYASEKNYYSKLKIGEHQVQIVALKYSSSNLAMMIVLPKDTKSLEQLVKELPQHQKELLSASLSFVKIDLQMPKFKLESRQKLSRVLKEMGLGEAFTKGGDFGGIVNTTEPLKIGAVEQVVAIEVNEDGTKVAAATSKLSRPNSVVDLIGSESDKSLTKSRDAS